jgi:hypothetical protein
MASVIRFPELLGPQLLVKKAGEAASLLPTSAALHPDAAFVAVLVAAPGWSGNCRNLVRALRTATAAGTTSGALDVVFCSLDHHRRKRAAPHFASMPAAWRALPFGGGGGGGAEEGGGDAATALRAALGVTLLPSLVLFDARTGAVVSLDAKADVLNCAGAGEEGEEGTDGGGGGAERLLALWKRAADAARTEGAAGAERLLADARATVAAAAAQRAGPARIVASLVAEGFKAPHAHEAVRETGGRSQQAAVMFITSKYGYHPNRHSGG